MSCWWLEISHGEVFIPCYYSATQSCPTLCNPMDCGTPGLLAHHFPKFAQVHVHSIGDAIQLSHPLMPSSPSAFNLSQHQRLFQSAVHIRWPKYWSFTFNISPSNKYSELISLKIDWFDLLAVQGTLRSLIQHCSSKASILRCSTFFIVQLSQPYMTTGKTMALTIPTFVGRAMSAFQHTVYVCHSFPMYMYMYFLYNSICISVYLLGKKS